MTSFPQSILDLHCDLYAGGWQSITSDVYNRQGTSPAVTIKRGRPDETTLQPSPSTASFQLNNRSGNFTIRNPVGAWYGLIGRNSALRFSVPAAANYLRFADDNLSYASCPDAAGLHITGDIDVRFDMNLDNWTPSVLASKWTATSTGAITRCWCLLLNGDGTLTFAWSTAGTQASIEQAQSTLPVPLGPEVAVRATLSASTGVVTFYTAPNISGTWTQLGQAVSLGFSTSINSSATTPVVVGYAAGPGFDAGDGSFPDTAYSGCLGQVFAFQVLSGIGGTTEASPSFTSQAAGTTSFTDAQSNTWTLSGTSEISGRDYRFHGQVPAWPVRWDPTGTDVWEPIQASGVLRWLSQGSADSPSPIKRAILSQPGIYAPIAYWPCEDGAGATQLGSALGGPPLLIQGSPTLSSNSSLVCSAPLPALNGAAWSGQVPAYPASSVNVLRFLTVAASTESGGLAQMVTNGTVRFVTIGLAGGNLTFNGYDVNGSNLFSLTTSVTGPCLVSAELVQSGGSVVATMYMLVPGQSTPTSVTTTLGSSTVGQVTGVTGGASMQLSTTVLGHMWVQSASDPLSDFAAPLAAWAGETAGNRFARLCAENNLGCRIYGYPGTSVPMGPQSIDTLLNILQECETADRGQIFEPRTAVGLGYRTLASLVSQPAAVTLNYAAAQLQGQLEPVDDDVMTRNDIALTRGSSQVQGGAYELTLDDGSAMSISQPPAGVGDYQDTETVNLRADSQLWDEAGWILHVLTYPGERYPSIPVNLARPQIYNTAGLTALIQAVDIGDYIAVSSPPSFLPPDQIRQLAWGSQEVLGGYIWAILWNTVPEIPYETGIVGDAVYGHADTDGSQVHTGISNSATSMLVDTTGPSGILWTTSAGSPWTFTVSGTPVLDSYFIVTTAQSASINVGDWFTISAFPGAIFQVTSLSPPSGGFVNVSFTPNAASGVNSPDVVTQVTGDFPFDIAVAGERMTVTGITGASSPQTFTLVRSVNGVVKAQSAGTDVRLFYPAIIALT